MLNFMKFFLWVPRTVSYRFLKVLKTFSYRFLMSFIIKRFLQNHNSTSTEFPFYSHSSTKKSVVQEGKILRNIEMRKKYFLHCSFDSFIMFFLYFCGTWKETKSLIKKILYRENNGKIEIFMNFKFRNLFSFRSL